MLSAPLRAQLLPGECQRQFTRPQGHLLNCVLFFTATHRSSNAPAAERWRTHALSKPLRPSAQLCTFAARGNRFEAACSIRPLQRSQLASWAQAPGWGEQGHLGQGGRGGLR
mmetsp:Transcript_20917/g.58213  ORF Transcript_20917/g.58213 Transcript_20917/m.58213 type:complete len:112 (+) Transcript_20917:577-912(+)